MLSLVLDVDFMTLTILKLEFSFMFLEFVIYFKASSQNFVENHKYNVILLYCKQILDIHLFNITYLHHPLKYAYFSWDICCHHNLMGFVDQCGFKYITIFVNLGIFWHFETVTNIRTWIKSHKYWRML